MGITCSSGTADVAVINSQIGLLLLPMHSSSKWFMPKQSLH